MSLSKYICYSQSVVSKIRNTLLEDEQLFLIWYDVLISFSGTFDTCVAFADVDGWLTFGGMGNVALFGRMTPKISGRRLKGTCIGSGSLVLMRCLRFLL